MQNSIFNSQPARPVSSQKTRWFSYALIFGLTTAATSVMMLCPCDTVGIHDYNAISLVAVATLFGIAATYVLYRRMSSDSGITGFLRAVIALAIVGLCLFAELFLAMEIVARMANPR